MIENLTLNISLVAIIISLLVLLRLRVGPGISSGQILTASVFRLILTWAGDRDLETCETMWITVYIYLSNIW